VPALADGWYRLTIKINPNVNTAESPAIVIEVASREFRWSTSRESAYARLNR